MPAERDRDRGDPDDVDLDAVLEDFSERSGPDPAREPGVDPAGGDEEERGGEPPPP